MKIHDISVLVHNGIPTWPGDPKLSMTLASSIAKGGVVNLTRLEMGAHTGTHMDAPFHFYKDGSGTDELPLDVLLGRCRVFDLTDITEHISPAILERCDWKVVGDEDVTRALFKTRNSRHWANDDCEFDREFLALTGDAAMQLVHRGVKLVGVDYLSVEAYGSKTHPVHDTLLGAGVVIIEALNLSEVAAGDYELIALPVKLKGADGAPARVVLRELE
ncbi:MAG TPA: cyclase family protein [Verrucomicrobiae bacterium]|nr:cyclase family protein [Verrucomicrobiae bacterium]